MPRGKSLECVRQGLEELSCEAGNDESYHGTDQFPQQHDTSLARVADSNVVTLNVGGRKFSCRRSVWLGLSH